MVLWVLDKDCYRLGSLIAGAVQCRGEAACPATSLGYVRLALIDVDMVVLDPVFAVWLISGMSGVISALVRAGLLLIFVALSACLNHPLLPLHILHHCP